MITKKITFVIAIIAIYSNAFGQITFNGNSSYTYTDVGGPAPTCSPGEVYYNGTPNDSQFSTTGNCMTLTDGSTGANSGMWVGVCDVLDLTNDFVVCFDADFGSNNGSGDGIAFVLNGTGSVAPFPGEGGFIGYGNNGGDVVGIEFDSFADGDIGCHHSEINYGGINGTQLSSPIPLEICCGSIIGSGSNSICIYWEVSSGTTGTLTAVYNGQVVAEYTGDLGGLVGTNPQWGFTAGANASGQVQTVCNVNMDNQLATNGSPSFTCAYLDASNFSATPDPATLCEGNCLNIALSGPAGSSFCWVADDNINVNGESLTVQTGSTIDDCPTNDDFNPGGPPTYPNDQVITYTIAPSAGGCVGESFQVTVNLLDELNPICACTQPIVTATPNPESICSGGTTSITLTSSEASTTYEWSAIDNPNVSGASTTTQSGTTISETLINISSIDQVVTYTVTPSAAGCVGNPIIVNVTVKPIPTITNAILTEEFCSGGTTGIVPTADVAGTTFSWTAVGSSVNVTGFSASGSGNISETLTNSGTAVETVTYTVTPIGPGTPTCPGIPVDFVVTVNPVPTITNVILTEEFCSGGTTGIVPTADVAGTTFTWTAVGSSGNVTGFSASGSGNISETLTNIGTAIETVTYTVTPLGPGTPTCPGTAVDFVVTVNPVPTITNAILTEEFCSLGTTAIVPTADVTGTTFTWTAVGSSGNVTGFSGSGSGNISETLTNSGTAVETVTYTVTPIGPGTPTCPGTPVDFVVTVNPVPTITNAILTEELCSGGTTGILPTADVAGTTFTWTAVGSSVNVTGFSATGSGNISETLTNSGTAVETVTYTVNPVGPGTPTCLGTPVDFVVTVNPFPTITNVILTEEFCSGGTTGIVPTADVAGTTLTWIAVGSSGNVTGFSASGSGNISETLTNSGTAVETVAYTVTPIGPGTPTCPGSPVDFVVTVNPIPTLAVQDSTGCSPFLLNLTNPTYWNSDIGTLSYFTDPGLSSPVVDPTAVGPGTYYIQADNIGCSSTAPVTVTETASPVIATVVSDPTICNATDGSIEVTLSSGATSLGTLNWTGTAIGTNGTADITVDSPDIAGLGAGSYNVTFTDANGCVSNTELVVLNNPGAPIIGPISDTVSCADYDLVLANVTGTNLNTTGALSFYTLTGGPLAVGQQVITDQTFTAFTDTTIFVYDESGACSAEIQFDITINTTPTLLVQDSTTCSPNTVELSDMTYWSSDVGIMTWYSDAGLSSILPSTNAGAGTYYVEADNFGCTSNGQVIVTVNTTPTLALQDTTVCSPATVDITDVTYWSSDIGTLSYFESDGTTPMTTQATAGAGTYVISANNAGCITTGNVTVTVNTTPTLTLADPAPVCSPATVDITAGAVSSTDVGTMAYYSDAGLSILVPDPTTVGAGTYYIEATNLSCTSNGSVTVVVNITPTLTLADPAAVCSPLTVDITVGAVSSTDVGTMLYYSDVAMTILVPDATAVGNGIYYVEATNVGCTSSGSITVTVNTTPTLTLVDPVPVCSPLTIDITTGAISSTDVGTMAYYSDAGLSILVPDPTTVGAGTYYIEATNLSCTSNGSVTVVVNITPTLTLADPAAVCSPLTVDITVGAVSSTDVGTMLYYSDVAMTILVPDATAVGNGIYYVEATNLGCTSNGSVTVTVVTTPDVDTQTPVEVCDSYELPIITGAALSGAQNYFDATGGPTVANIVTGPITSSTTLFVYDGASGCSDEETLLITINPLPSVTLVSGGDTYCEGEAVSEILVDVTGTGNFTVDYTLDGAALSTSGTTNPLSLGNAAGVYIITNITDGTACTNGANGSQTIVVNPIPSAPLAGSDSEYCSTVDPNLMTASGGGGILTWYSDAALTNILGTGTTLNPSIGLGVTTYYVTETEFGCEGPTSQVVISINGCEITIPTAFTPDGDGMNDDWEILDIDKTYPNNIVYVYNRWGNLLFTSVQGDYDNNRWDGTYKELSLPVGSYYFIIHYNDKANETETGTVSIILNK